MNYKTLKKYIEIIFIILFSIDPQRHKMRGGAGAGAGAGNNSNAKNNQSGQEEEQPEEDNKDNKEKDGLIEQIEEFFNMIGEIIKLVYDKVMVYVYIVLSHVLIGSVFPAVPFVIVLGGMSTFFKFIIQRLNNL